MPVMSREQAQQVRKAICDAVWEGQIQQMSTKEIAEKYGGSIAFVLGLLHSICNLTSGDSRFAPNPEREQYPRIADGSTFFPGIVDVGDRGCVSGDDRPKKYYWGSD